MILNKDKNITMEEMAWLRQKRILQRKIKIEKEKTKLMNQLKEKTKATTTKILILFLFINCSIIELFTGWATIKSIELTLQTGIAPDFTPLVALIGAVVGEVIGFAVYALKSIKENTAGGVTYLNAQHDLNKEGSNNNDTAVG